MCPCLGGDVQSFPRWQVPHRGVCFVTLLFLEAATLPDVSRKAKNSCGHISNPQARCTACVLNCRFQVHTGLDILVSSVEAMIFQTEGCLATGELSLPLAFQVPPVQEGREESLFLSALEPWDSPQLLEDTIPTGSFCQSPGWLVSLRVTCSVYSSFTASVIVLYCDVGNIWTQILSSTL